MTERITPDSTRREGISARPIRLADGAAWGFSGPTVRLFPRVVREVDPLGRLVERIAVGVRFGFPPEAQTLVDALRAACERGTAREQYEAFFPLAACLLRRAHEISLQAACDLFSVSADELPRLVREVMAIVAEADRAAESTPSEVLIP